MKVALVHDYIKEYGGAERVLEALHEAYPNAVVYTSVYLPKYLGPHRKRFENWKIKTSWADVIPFNSKLISPLRLVAPELFKSLDLSEYDVVIVSATGAYSPNMIKTKSEKNSAVHICYSHTPPRYLYGYETARDYKNNPVTRFIAGTSFHFLRLMDFQSSQKVDYFIANSEETKKRIEKFYRKNSKVIYPPVEVGSVNIERGNYYLAGGRMARAKHTDLIVEAFAQNGLPLKVFGRGFAGFESEVKELAKGASNIQFVGEVSDEEKSRLMAGAKAFVFASKDEDFGITPVESMMLGTPVIAHHSGGVLETVEEGKTGIFFNDLNHQSINAAITKFEKIKWDEKAIKKHAEKFSKERFIKEIKTFVDSKVK